MPTPAERQALLFLAGVALLGGGVRLLGMPSAAALRDAPGAARAAAGAGGGDTAGLRRQRGAVAVARAGQGGARPPRSRTGWRPAPENPVAAPAPPPLDVNRATAAELERLPRVGPALARRILSDRDRHGPYPALEALGRVPGIGPATLRVLEPHVTFSAGPSLYRVGGRAPEPLPPK